MTNLSQMRNNMILGQFLPGLIKNKKIIEFFSSTPRESFLPEKLKSLAYSDLNIKLNNKRYLPSPFNTAKILQEANIKGSEVVLLIGANLGYEALVVSKLVDTVIALEEDINMKEKAEKNLKKLNIENIVMINSNHRSGHKKLGPYDLIVCLVPSIDISPLLLEQLSDEGKLYYCEKHNIYTNESKLNVFYRKGKSFVKDSLFDLNIPSPADPVKQEEKFDFY